jgi:hypothetical protein
MSKSDEFNLRHFYVQFSMSRLKKISVEEETFIVDIIFNFQRRLSLEGIFTFLE